MKAEIKFNIPEAVKGEVSEKEIFDWVAFNTGYSCEIDTRNPLYDYQFEATDLDIKE